MGLMDSLDFLLPAQDAHSLRKRIARSRHWLRDHSRFIPIILTTIVLYVCSSIPLVTADEKADVKPVENAFKISDRAMEIHRRAYVWDGHNDLPWALRKAGDQTFSKIDIRNPQSELHTDISRLRQGNVGAQFWSVYVPSKERFQGTAFQTTLEQIAIVKAMVAKYPDVFELATTASDVVRIQKSGKVASLIGVEGGHSIENSISLLRQLRAAGAHYMTLTHGDSLDWADAATDKPISHGLSAFGEEVVRELNRLGMLVDLSHVSPDTMRDAIRISSAPVMFSHSSAQAVADHPRNVPDDILREVRDNGGIVMVNFFSGFVEPRSAINMQKMFDIRRELDAKYGSDKASIDREYERWKAEHPIFRGDASIVVDHIEHIVKIAGIDHVGIGSDFDGITSLPVGLEDVAKYPVITEMLLQRGYFEQDIHKVLYQNMLRVMQRCDELAKDRR
jgi:membrane dipeptidase